MGVGSSSSKWTSSWCFSFFYLSTPLPLKLPVSDLLPASQCFLHLPQPRFARPAASYLFSHSGPIASETLGWRRKQDDKHEHPSLQHQQRWRKVRCEGGGSHFLRVQHKLCATPSPPPLISISLLPKHLKACHCWSLFGSHVLNIDSNHNCTCCTISLETD